MNKHILMVIDNQLNPNKYTGEELRQTNADAAAQAATCAAYAADAAAADAAAADAAQAAAYWLEQYFKQTGENKQDYIDAINKDNKQ